jgi:hypothetical protein
MEALSTLIFGGDAYNGKLISAGGFKFEKIIPEPATLEVSMAEVIFGNKNLGVGGAIIISAWLINKDNWALTSLDISNNEIGNGAAGQALGRMLKINTTLKTLNLSNNVIKLGSATREGKQRALAFAEGIAAGLAGNGGILSVNLLKNEINVEQAEDLVSILKEHPTLKSLCGNKGEETGLDMSGKMSGAGDAIMLAVEIVNTRTLSFLDISSNDICNKRIIGPKKVDVQASEGDIVEFNGAPGALTTWNDTIFGFIPLSGIQAIATAIKDMGAISSVNLLENGIRIDQARALVIILKEHPTLKSLCGNTGDETELDMSGKMSGAEDAIMLAAEIVDNGAMTSLKLPSNHL